MNFYLRHALLLILVHHAVQLMSIAMNLPQSNENLLRLDQMFLQTNCLIVDEKNLFLNHISSARNENDEENSYSHRRDAYAGQQVQCTNHHTHILMF